jgi:hypothetical protein
MRRRQTLETQLIVHAQFRFWFVELLEFFGAFLNICLVHRPEYTDRAIEVGGTREGQSFVLKV